MKKSDDRKSTVSILLGRGRKALSLTCALVGWVVILWWLLGTESTKFAIDGGTVGTWKAELGFSLLFWPVEFPIWLGVILLGVGGLVAVFYGRRWLVWALRIISIPMGALAVWSLQTDTVIGDRPSDLAIIILVAAAWILPIRRRKSLPPPGGPAPNVGGE